MTTKLTWKQIQEEYTNRNKPKIVIGQKTNSEQLEMTKSECMEYIRHWSLCDEAEIKFLTDKELFMEYIKNGNSLCDEAKERLFNMKD